MIVGTAGHIDHGKTSLVKRLTGIDADRLAEEKARGITIDLGYAYQPLPDGAVLGFVDVPGHEKFIHNMLAGATGIDYVLLVVAADDGPMPQTREHLAILELLGLTEGIVALTKIDRVDAARREAAVAEVHQLLAGTVCVGFTVLPVSAVTGEGIDALQARLHEAAMMRAASTQADGHFRLAVDRSFSLAGIGTIVTGTVFSGRVGVGDRLTISPLGVEVRVRGLHAQNREAQIGRLGQRCAINVVAPQLDRRDITRGQWLLATPLHAPSSRLDTRMSLLASEAKPLRHWTPVHVHLGASHVTGRLALLEDERLHPGQNALVQLVLDEPVGALHGDRFIVRDQSAQRTLGGGRVLDAFPPLRGRRKPQHLALLRALDAPTPAEALRNLLDVQASGVDLDWFAQLHNLREPELAAVLASVPLHTFKPAGGAAAAGPPLGFKREHWAHCVAQLTVWLASFHEQNPDSPGARLDQLRAALPDKPPPAVVAGILDQLVTSGEVARAGSRFHLCGHAVRLGAMEQVLWERALPALIESGLTPPRVADLAKQLSANEELLRQLFGKLARMGQLHPVRREVFFLPQTVARLAAQTEVLAHAHPKGVVTVGPFREHTGMNRALSIPMLEYFDRTGFTWRHKDGRRLRRASAAVFGEAGSSP